MKKRFLGLISVLFLVSLLAYSATIGLAPFDAPTSLAAGVSTNLTSTVPIDLTNMLPANNPMVRLNVSLTGTAAATNGTITVYFAASKDGTIFETASQSAIKLVITPSGTTSAAFGDWFNLVGVQSIKVGRLESTSGGNVSSLAVTLSRPTGP